MVYCSKAGESTAGWQACFKVDIALEVVGQSFQGPAEGPSSHMTQSADPVWLSAEMLKSIFCKPFIRKGSMFLSSLEVLHSSLPT